MTKQGVIRGSILIIVLWVLCLLSTFAVILGQTVRQRLALLGRLQERDKLHYISEAGIRTAILELNKEEFEGFNTIRDRWADNAGVFANIPVGDGLFSVCYEYFDDMSGSMMTKYGLIDEERKININKADYAILVRLFRIVLGMEEPGAQELATSVIDWRDSDNTSVSPTEGAEDTYYTFLSRSYEAKDADFEVPEELLLVKGFDRVIFDRLKDYITVYGGGKVNINTCSRIALLALGLGEGLTEKIAVFRSGPDKEFGTTDDNIFKADSDIAGTLSRASQLSPSELAELSRVAESGLGVASSYFTIRSSGRLKEKKNILNATCVVNRDNEILYWQEE